MGAPVPADDLPSGGAVPADDLPGPVTADPAEKIAGSKAFRVLQGIADPFYAVGQVVDKGMAAVGVPEMFRPELANIRRRIEPMIETGRQAAGSEGTDWARVAGNVVSPAGMAAMKAAPAAGALGRIGQGAAIGGTVGAASPVAESEPDYWTSKGGQVLLGTVLGGGIQAGAEGVKAVGRGLGNVADLVAPGGAERILTRYQKRIIGDEQIPNVVQALKTQPANAVPGYQQTAAERLVGVPGGSPVAAAQKITAQTPGGISAQFGQRFVDQKTALQAAAQARDDALLPMAQNILGRANQNGVEVAGIERGIDAALNKPGIRASDVVQRTMASIKDKLATTSQHGIVDANDLWTIRKEIGNTIKTHAKDTANWDKRMTAGLERDVQKAIDDAIERAGGSGWKQFMAEYSKRSQAIRDTAEAAKNAYRPVQRTELGGGVNIAEETRTKLPNMLTRPMMATNWVLKKMGAGVEQRIDPAAAERYLNPEKLAEALEQLPLAQRSAVLQNLVQLGRVPAIGGIAAGAQQQQ